MKPLYDHFLVIQTQEDIDNEKQRVDAEKARIEKAKKTKTDKPRIITSLKEQNIEKEDYPFLEHGVEFPVYTVAAVGKDCEEVKVGDRVIVRVNTRPETVIYGGKMYLSMAERSITMIL